MWVRLAWLGCISWVLLACQSGEDTATDDSANATSGAGGAKAGASGAPSAGASSGAQTGGTHAGAVGHDDNPGGAANGGNENGGAAANVAGEGGAPPDERLGTVCESADACGPKLACCYPCGVQGCDSVCQVPCKADMPGCSNGCLALP